MRYSEGERVRVQLGKDDYDYERYHGRTGVITSVSEDDLSGLTGDERDDDHYKVEFDDGDTMQFRWRDLERVE